jgi:hypothetical protein
VTYKLQVKFSSHGPDAEYVTIAHYPDSRATEAYDDGHFMDQPDDEVCLLHPDGKRVRIYPMEKL